MDKEKERHQDVVDNDSLSEAFFGGTLIRN